jgi:hypothetical protein
MHAEFAATGAAIFCAVALIIMHGRTPGRFPLCSSGPPCNFARSISSRTLLPLIDLQPRLSSGEIIKPSLSARETSTLHIEFAAHVNQQLDGAFEKKEQQTLCNHLQLQDAVKLASFNYCALNFSCTIKLQQ